MPYTLPVVNNITPSSSFLVDPSDFTMSMFIHTVAAEDPPEPTHSEVYVEQWQTSFFGRETIDSLLATLDRLDAKADEEGST